MMPIVLQGGELVEISDKNLGMPTERQLAPAPTSISDRQFAQQLAVDGVITEAEALAWAARGDLPATLDAVVSQLGEQEFAARMLLSSATSYHRDHSLTAMLSGLLGYDGQELDALWARAAAL